jgi:uracil-DNA glycosylase family 4
MTVSDGRRSAILQEMEIPVWVSRRPASAVAAVPAPSDLPGVSHPHSPPDGVSLRQQAMACTACPELVAQRRQVVWGSGNERAPWLFVGEAPGEQEDRQGEPFVGRAGRLLENMLAALGLRRDVDVYITNAVKCRPPGNRTPLPGEQQACRGYLEQQVALIQPRLIVALGLIAAQNLLNREDPLWLLREEVHHRYRGIPLVVTYHPAYLLRNTAMKGKAWQDLCRARNLMRSLLAEESAAADLQARQTRST